MFILSFHYKKADTGFREKLVLDDEGVMNFFSDLKAAGITECVYLSTCNRCEITGTRDYRTAMNLFSARTGLETSQLREHILIFEGERAIRHLFQVCSGLDSMVVGEDEILGQVRNAYNFSKEKGFTAYELNTVYQAALSCAKRIKTQTLLSKSAVSVATLAAYEVHRFRPGKKKVLIAGASGDTGNKVILNLLSYGDCEILATARHSHSRQKVKEVPFESRYQYADQADVIISATKAPHYVFLTSCLKKLSHKDRLFVDLAVPRDIDEDVCQIPGARLLTIDDFEKISEQHNRRKFHEVQTAEEMVREDMEELLKTLQFHEFFPIFQKMRSSDDYDFVHFIYRFRDTADAGELKSFLDVLRRMENKV